MVKGRQSAKAEASKSSQSGKGDMPESPRKGGKKAVPVEFQQAGQIDISAHPEEGYISQLFDELSGESDFPKDQVDFDVDQARRDRATQDKSALFATAGAQPIPLDVEKLSDTISKVFLAANIKILPEFRDFILAEASSMNRNLTEDEISWICKGMALERKYSLIHSAQQMVDQLKQELIKLTSTNNKISETEVKLRENTATLSAIRFSAPDKEKIPAPGSAASSSMDKKKEKITSETELFKLRQVMIFLGIPADLAVTPYCEQAGRETITSEVLELYDLNQVSGTLKTALYDAICERAIELTETWNQNQE